MKNKERQEKLDNSKWLRSEIMRFDLSGMMDYCFHCKNQDDNCCCQATQDERESESLCATAYNRMKRNGRV